MKSEIAHLKSQIVKSIGLLENEGFVAKASPTKIALERKKLYDFQFKLNSITKNIEHDLSMFLEGIFVSYFIEEIRFDKYVGELFNPDYYSIVNHNDIKSEEKEELLSLILNNELSELFLRNSNRYL